MSVIQMKFERLKDLRMENDYSQLEIANILQIARQTYNHYEVGENIIPLKHVNMLSNLYHVSIDYILGLTNIRKYNNSIEKIELTKSGQRLKEWRKEEKLTQTTLANILNTFHTVVVDYEHSKNLIATPFLYTICKKYKISADYLLGKIEEPKYLK